MSDNELQLTRRSQLATAALVLGIITTIMPILFAATSAEARRRALHNLGITPASEYHNQGFNSWQGPRVLFLLTTTAASVIGLSMAAIARRTAKDHELAIAAICVNVSGLFCGSLLLWCIS